jgi:hypothetical protein
MRKHLVWVLGLAVAIAAAGVAWAPQTEDVNGTISPSKLPKTKRVPASLTFGTGPHTATGEPLSPARRAQVFFDDEIAIFSRGLPTCSVSRINGRSTTAAKNACGSAQIGGGSASANVGGVNVPVVVTAFNGTNKTILLHSAPAIGSPVVLVGKLKSASGDFGILLDVDEPPLAGGVGVLISFRAKVRKIYRFQGKLRSFITAKCGDGNRKLNYKAQFSYANGSSASATDTQNCTVRR